MPKRLAGYDYSQPGFYFVTICTQHHRLVFGTIVDGQVSLKRPGQIAQSVWVTLPRRFAHVNLHEYVFMPNHLHAILELTELDPTQTGKRAALWGSCGCLRRRPRTTSVMQKASRGLPGKMTITRR
jgi:REP element-mobilizing transposase RayT